MQSADEFDTAMRAIPANSNIHLSVGTSLTRGINGNGPPGTGFVFQNGWKIYGAGRSESSGTVVKLIDVVLRTVVLTNVTYNDVGVNAVFQSPNSAGYSAMEVHDLVIDCNAINIYSSKTNTAQISISGAILIGSDVRIDNVLVLRSSGDYPVESEVFILKVENTQSSITGAKINNCIVRSFYEKYGNGKCSAIIIGSGSGGSGYTVQGEATNNYVYLNSLGIAASEYGFNVGASAGVTFRGNWCSGAQRSFNLKEARKLAHFVNFRGNASIFHRGEGQNRLQAAHSWSCSD